MNTPSIKTLTSRLNVSRDKAIQIKTLMADPASAPTPESWHSRGKAIDRAMYAINELLEFHGVDYAASKKDSIFYYTGVEYCNAGDPYICTVIYDRAENRFLIASIGDILERSPSRFD